MKVRLLLTILITCTALVVAGFVFWRSKQTVVEVVQPLQQLRQFPDAIDATVEGSLQDQINAQEVTVSPQELVEQLQVQPQQQETSIEVFASTLHKPLGIVTLADGRVVVSDAQAGTITIFADTDGDFVSDDKFVVASNLSYPSGLVLVDDTLYIAQSNEISFIPSLSQQKKETKPQLFISLSSTQKEVPHTLVISDEYLAISTASLCIECSNENEKGGIEVYDRSTKLVLYQRKNLYAPSIANIQGSTVTYFDQALFGSFDMKDTLTSHDFLTSQTSQLMSFEYGSHPSSLLTYTGTLFPEWSGATLISLSGSFVESKPKGYEIRLISQASDSSSFTSLFTTTFIKNNQVRAKPHALAQGSRGEVYITDSYGGKVFVVVKR